MDISPFSRLFHPTSDPSFVITSVIYSSGPNQLPHTPCLSAHISSCYAIPARFQASIAIPSIPLLPPDSRLCLLPVSSIIKLIKGAKWIIQIPVAAGPSSAPSHASLCLLQGIIHRALSLYTNAIQAGGAHTHGPCKHSATD